MNEVINDISAKVRELLTALGYKPAEENETLINFSVRYVIRSVLDNCNLDELPENLYPLTIRLAAGEFLFAMKGTGGLAGFDVNIDAAVKTIEEGDVSVTFAIGDGCMTPEQRLDALIAALRQPDKSSLARYRRLAW